MLSLQSFLREGRVVGPCWEKLNLKDLKVSLRQAHEMLRELMLRDEVVREAFINAT